MTEKIKDMLEWIYCIIIALVLALLFRYFIGTPTVVQQRSMYPTLKENQRLILNRTFRITGKPIEVGDIITFEAPSAAYTRYNVSQSNPVAKYEYEFDNIFQKFMYYIIEKTKTSYIKRVVAVEGNHVEIKDNKVFINGKELEEEYLSDDVVTESQVFTDFIVPEGYVFAIGDNRTKSKDCRELGCIPVDKVEGIVVLRFWPLDVFGKVN
mgnify:CR=1 FL=1